MIALRCSGLPEAFACAQSVRKGPTGLRVERSHEGAGAGLAVHELLAAHVLGAVDLDVAHAAAAHDASPAEVGALFAAGRRAWDALHDEIPGEIRSEVSLAAEFAADFVSEGFSLTGHPDVLGVDLEFGEATILDWKSGRVDRNHYHQLAGYAALVFAAHPQVSKAKAAIVWLRSGEREVYAFSRPTIGAWIDRVRAEIVAADASAYRVGKQCDHCARAHDCPGATALARRDVAALSSDDVAAMVKAKLEGIAPADLGRLYRQAKSVGAMAEAVRKLTKERVTAAGGKMDLGDGEELAIEPQERREIDTARAWPVLQARLTGEQIAGAVTVGLTAAGDAVAEMAPRGQKQKARAELAKALDDAGAFSKTSVDFLVLRRSGVK